MFSFVLHLNVCHILITEVHTVQLDDLVCLFVLSLSPAQGSQMKISS